MAGNASESVIDLYRRNAAQWDAARRSSGWNDRVWIEAFADNLARGSRVLDLGCGGGEPVARLLIERGMHVTGVDASPEMIALARDRLPGQQWITADMRRLALDRRFDGILAWDSYFHLAPEAQRAMFAVFDAHAENDAVLMFNTGPEHGGAQAHSPSRTSPCITRALPQRSTELCLTVSVSRSFAMPRTTRGAVEERLGCAGANDPSSLILWGIPAVIDRRLSTVFGRSFVGVGH